ncbi:MAG TPA: alpha-E domain-containing protein, partial [Casimicrobiaceae bacterium]
MLCRTANELYWMARHIERAENTARLLDVTYRMSLLPYELIEPGLAWAEPWAVPLITSGLATEFYQRFQQLSAENVLRFMTLDAGTPSSIYCCLRAARESARSVRGAITSEMYEDLNSSWLEVRVQDYDRIQAHGVSEFLEWVKMRSHLFRGVTFGTMLRDEAYHFIRLGTHVERADNTARILDVKYHTLLPSAADVGGAVDYYQWGALLRSLSGFESYRKIYSDVITPRRVAELLILREDMPRSLHACMIFIHETLEMLCDKSSREVERASGELYS